MKLRTCLFWLHLAAGITAGVVIMSMSVSGILIAYERQILDWVEHDSRIVEIPDAPARLGIGKLLEKLQQSNPGVDPATVVLYSDPGLAVRVAAGRDGLFFLDPYTRGVTVERDRFVRDFFQFMTEWHRWLGQEGKGKEVGKAITGAAGLCFLFLLVSGIILWIPRIWSLRSLKAAGLLDRNLRGKARDWNWHNVWGIWAAPVLLVLTVTGIIISYAWAGDLLYRLTGNMPPPRSRSEPAGAAKKSTPPINTEGLDGLVQIAQNQWPEWKSIQFRIPRSAKESITFNLDKGDGTRPDRRAQLVISRPEGKITVWEPYATWNSGRKLRSWVKTVHTGQAGGLLGQSLAVFGAFSSAVLVWTGFSLGFRRFASFLRCQKNGPAAVR